MARTRREQPKWKVVTTARNQLEAGMIAERLENAGIPASVQSESIANTYAFSVGPLAKALILVPESFYQQALDELGLDDPHFRG